MPGGGHYWTRKGVAIGRDLTNRNKRKSMQERRNTLAQQMKLIGENAQQGQKALEELYRSTESNLALAKHAEGWEWKEVDVKAKEAAI